MFLTNEKWFLSPDFYIKSKHNKTKHYSWAAVAVAVVVVVVAVVACCNTTNVIVSNKTGSTQQYVVSEDFDNPNQQQLQLF